MPPKKDDITIHDLVAHMRAMEQHLREEIIGNRKQMVFMERRLMAHIKGTDDLDDRVQEIEEEHLPERMQNVEKAVGLLG